MTGLASGPPMVMALFDRVSVTLVVFGFVVVAAFIGAIVWYTKRKQTEQEVNEDSDEERLQQQRERSHVALRKRAFHGTPVEAKAVAAITALLTVYVSFEVYTYFKTGSPSQFAYASATKNAVLVLIGGVGFTWLKSRWDNRYGRLIALLESQPDEGRSETTPMVIYYHKDDTVETERGESIHAYAERKTFGLFRLPKRVADVPLVRDSDKITRPSDDKVTYSIPDRATEVGDGDYVFRTKGRKVSRSQESPVDVVWKSAFSMSRQQKRRHEQDMEMMHIDLQELKATKASLAERVMVLEKQLEAAVQQNWEDFVDKTEKIWEMFGDGSPSSDDKVEVPREAVDMPGRSSRNGVPPKPDGSTTSERSYAENGGDR